MNHREYHIISIEKGQTTLANSKRIRLNVLAKKTHTDEIVELKNISLPTYAIVGDLIKWCEHNYYDVIDGNGGFVYRR